MTRMTEDDLALTDYNLLWMTRMTQDLTIMTGMTRMTGMTGTDLGYSQWY